MWKMKKNYQNRYEIITETTEKCMTYPNCNGKEDTIEHVLEFQTAETRLHSFL